MNYGKAIKSINPSAEFTLDNDDLDNIVWLNNTTPISKADIQAKQAELQTAYDAEQYQRDREKEYPSWQDQMDMLWHSIDENAELKQKYFAFYEAIKAVKAKYPK
jgi:hypothetical protein|tara:strand:- start:12 stop:326 length:315 start_codon:yes stop_codon:yes gene_type:complete